MSLTLVSLPTYEGGGCQNPRCDGSGKQRVLSVEEVEHVYPIKDKYGWWPLPPQATHVCTVCGFCYEGISEDYRSRQRPTPDPENELPVEEFDWDPEAQFELTVREAVEAFVRACPDEYDADTVAAGVGRYVAGASPEFAKDVMLSMDDYEDTVLTAADMM